MNIFMTRNNEDVSYKVMRRMQFNGMKDGQ